jgi:hypothetical protein
MQIDQVVPGLAAGVGVRLSPNGKTAYYVEWSIGRLDKVEVATGMVTTVETGLNLPEDVLVDWPTGEIFISERTGDIVHIAGRKTSRIRTSGDAPHQMALHTHGGHRDLYVVCYDSGRLLRIDLAGPTVHQVCSGLGHPVGLVVDHAAHHAWVTEQDTSALTRIALPGGAKTVLTTGLISPFYLAWDHAATGVFCVQRDPANSLLHIHFGPPLSITTVVGGLPWRPSGVAPNATDKLIYVCSDQELEVISAHGVKPPRRPRPPFVVHSIQFDWKNQAVHLKRQSTGAPVTLPEFLRGVRNEPACYVMGKLPRIQVVFEKRPGFVPGSTWTVGATGSLGGVRDKDITPVFGSGGLSNPIDFELMWPLPDQVERTDVSLNWFARPSPGPGLVAAIGSATHRLYMVLAQPTAPWVAETPWIEGLDIACVWAAGAADADTAAGLITQRYNGSGVVSYDTVQGATQYGFTTFSFSQMIDRLNGGPGLGGKVNCTDSADTVSTFSNLIGCDLWESRMEQSFALNEVIAIGYNVWAVPFGWGFSYHEVPWKGACTDSDNIFDGCLQVDGDADPTTAPHTPLLPQNMLFGDCTAMNYRKRLCTPAANGCPNCEAQPATRTRRPVA